MSAPRTHIPQPPHTAGERYKGLRQRIDPAQIPSPIDNQARDDAEWTTPTPTAPTSKPFLTLPGSGRPPLATTLSALPTSPACLDQGNAAPRFVRLTTWNLPNCARLAKECHIPLAAHFQPFADQPAGEEPVPLASTPSPPRCARCRAYINPWCPWLNAGQAWRCNLCKHETPTPPDYFCLLDPNGMRLDQQQRPELCRGAVDFEVGREYWAKGAPKVVDELWAVHEGEYAWLEGSEATAADPPASASHTRSGSIFSAALGGSGSSRHSRDGSLFGGFPSSTDHPSLPPVRAPQPLTYVFALDVSREAVQSGFLRASCEALRGVLFGEGPDAWADDPSSTVDPSSSAFTPALGLPPVFPPHSRLCLLTFDRAVHFYDFRADPGTG